jgi:putative ABC transport system ATP-binding protein
MNNIITIKNLKFSYKKDCNILDIESLDISKGDRLFLYGPSGCGKTTLLSILAGVLTAHKGSVKVLNHEFINLKPSTRDRIRGTEMGYIFQMFNLIPYLNVKENILLPCKISPLRRKNLSMEELKEKCIEVANNLKIGNILNKKVTEISIGQQQRVAAARALIGFPKLIIADEPTSSLDSENREQFLQNLFTQCETQKTTLIFVSHDKDLKKFFSHHISLPEINRVKI